MHHGPDKVVNAFRYTFFFLKGSSNCMYISSMFRVTNKPLKGWVYFLYCKIIECVLNICHNNKSISQSNQSVIFSWTYST